MLDFTIDNTNLIKEFLQLEHAYVLEETDFVDGYVLSEDDVFFHIETSGEAILDSSTYIDEEGNLQYYIPQSETVSMDDNGNIMEDGTGFDCTLVHISNHPNVVFISKKLLYPETEGDDNMAEVRFQVYADGFSDSDWIGELEDGTKIYNGFEFTSDAAGGFEIYHLRRGHTYHFQEIETWDEKQLLAGTADIRVSQEKGRIIGPENIRKDGNIEYTLTVLNHDEINLFTGGKGTVLFYLAGTILSGGALITILIRKRKQAEKQG